MQASCFTGQIWILSDIPEKATLAALGKVSDESRWEGVRHFSAHGTHGAIQLFDTQAKDQCMLSEK